MSPTASCVWELDPQLVLLFGGVLDLTKCRIAGGSTTLRVDFEDLRPHPTSSLFIPPLSLPFSLSLLPAGSWNVINQPVPFCCLLLAFAIIMDSYSLEAKPKPALLQVAFGCGILLKQQESSRHTVTLNFCVLFCVFHEYKVESIMPQTPRSWRRITSWLLS